MVDLKWHESLERVVVSVETARFFRRDVVRNRSAMVEYSSTIMEQLLTTPRRKNLGMSVSLGVAFEMASASYR